ncbi:PREDICTED: limulus clotting factor C-like [Priapulus caudatus]|uniref:Limulus clotting factor C-like n=1 Tax=Priapulus caudatus TaxID=37621 RepID=A0ABM1E599_PRICU|nr:PREDICTED: limulus clotting factor C-like [Priapulus caudatus]
MRGNHTLRFARGATLHYWCHYRESLTGSNQRTCLDDGTWSGYEPACEQRSELQTECTTTAAEVVGPAGVPVRVQCPPGCAAADDGVVYGTGIYRSDSHMCAAAVHAGKLSMAGGSVLVINNGRYSNFLRSKAHGMHSLAAVAAGDSFRFEGRVVPDSLTLQSASYGGAALGFAPSRAGVVACAAMAWFTTAARLAAVQ